MGTLLLSNPVGLYMHAECLVPLEQSKLAQKDDITGFELKELQLLVQGVMRNGLQVTAEQTNKDITIIRKWKLQNCGKSLKANKSG